MKKIKTLVCLLLLAALAVGFAGCETGSSKLKKLTGTWEYKMRENQDTVEILLENVDFCDEEIRLCEDVKLYSAKVLELTQDKRYSFSYDVDKTKECVRGFYRECFQVLYENRATLNEVYDYDFSQATEEEFLQIYAEMYQVDNFDGLLEVFTQEAYEYDNFEDWETGTFRLLGDTILVTMDGEDEEKSMGFEMEGDELTLEYVDGTEVYTRAEE